MHRAGQPPCRRRTPSEHSGCALLWCQSRYASEMRSRVRRYVDLHLKHRVAEFGAEVLRPRAGQPNGCRERWRYPRHRRAEIVARDVDLGDRQCLYTGQQISPVMGLAPGLTKSVWDGPRIAAPPKRTRNPVLLKADRILGLLTWSWQPVSPAGHHEKSPLKLSPDQAHTAFTGHWVIEDASTEGDCRADSSSDTESWEPGSTQAASPSMRGTK